MCFTGCNMKRFVKKLPLILLLSLNYQVNAMDKTNNYLLDRVNDNNVLVKIQYNEKNELTKIVNGNDCDLLGNMVNIPLNIRNSLFNNKSINSVNKQHFKQNYFVDNLKQLVDKNNIITVPNSCESAYDALIGCHLMKKMKELNNEKNACSFDVYNNKTNLGSIIQDIKKMYEYNNIEISYEGNNIIVSNFERKNNKVITNDFNKKLINITNNFNKKSIPENNINNNIYSMNQNFDKNRKFIDKIKELKGLNEQNNNRGIVKNKKDITTKDVLHNILCKYSDGIGKIISYQSVYYFGQNKDDTIYSMFESDLHRFNYDIIALLYRLKSNTDDFIKNGNKNPNTIQLFGLAWNVIYTYVLNNDLLHEWCNHSFDEYITNIVSPVFGEIIGIEIKNVDLNKNEQYINNNVNTNSSKENKLTQEQKGEIKNALSKDHHLGLDNVGATCYMNATLQCLANIYTTSLKMLEYGKNGKLKGNPNRYKLSLAFFEVLKNIYKLGKNNNKTSYAPNNFKKVLGEMNGLFAPTAANDAKDLLIYFIEQMHTELNTSLENNLNLVMPDNMDPTNRQQVLQCFAYEFMKKYQSVFSDEFYGSNLSVTHCDGCDIEKYSNQIFSFLIFPLMEAAKYCGKQYYDQQHNIVYNPQQILNLEDCFKYNQKTEFFQGQNQMYCNYCNRSSNARMYTRIDSAPNTLVLILNRGKGNLDYKYPFEFWEEINLKNYVNFHEQNGDSYYLSGVVSHMGNSGPSGHFIAYCKSSQNKNWYKYNDSIVSLSSWKEINTIGTPYIVFYTKVNRNKN